MRPAKGKPRLRLYEPITALNRFDGPEQDLKDEIYQRLFDHSEYRPKSGCQLYLGCMVNKESDQAVIRVGSRPYTVSRVSAWLFVRGFRLEEERWVVRSCGNGACFNPDHMRVVKNRKEALSVMRKMGWLARGTRKLTQKIANSLRCTWAGRPPSASRPEFIRHWAHHYGVLPQAVQRILDGLSWMPKAARKAGRKAGRKRRAPDARSDLHPGAELPPVGPVPGAGPVDPGHAHLPLPRRQHLGAGLRLGPG